MTFGELINDLMNMNHMGLGQYEVSKYNFGTGGTGIVHLDICLEQPKEKAVSDVPELDDSEISKNWFEDRSKYNSYFVNKEEQARKKREERKETKEPQTLGSYLSQFKGATLVSENCSLKPLSKETKENDISESVYITPKKRPTKRYIYFKSQETAKEFATEWEDDFEAHEKKSGSISKYRITRNTTDNELFKRGYMWVLSFRMECKTFEAMEQLLPDLKKNEHKGTRGGPCRRLYR